MADEFNPTFAPGDLIQGADQEFATICFEVLEVDEERGYLLQPDRHIKVDGMPDVWPMWCPPLPAIEVNYVKVGEV